MKTASTGQCLRLPAPPVSALTHSWGPRKMCQSPVSRNSKIERRMKRPKAVVGVMMMMIAFIITLGEIM